MDTALNSIFDKDEETLEECCQNLSTLSSRQWADDSESEIINKNNTMHVSSCAGERNRNGFETKTTVNGKLKSDVEDEETDEITCVELDVGISTGSLMMHALSKDSLVPKVDNFLDDNGDENGDDNDDDNDYDHGDCKDDDAHGDHDGAHNEILTSNKEISEAVQHDDSKRCFPKSDSFPSCEVVFLNKIHENGELPGEATNEGNDFSSVEAKITNISIKTQIKNVDNEAVEESKYDGQNLIDSDRVETFALDKDFDYDNVELTPKFSIRKDFYST